jgi:hypothetical protein
MKFDNSCVQLLTNQLYSVKEGGILRATFLALSGLFFLGLGAAVLATNHDLLEVALPYSVETELEVTLPRVRGPVYLLYQLEGFYQNGRLYSQSKSNAQLAGQSISPEAARRSCGANSSLNSDLARLGITHSWGGVPLDPAGVASPCGAIAFTTFNDSYRLLGPEGDELPVEQQGISWPGDRGTKFRRGPNSSALQWMDPEDERFINWMRTAGLPTFRKLWGYLEGGI